MRIFQRSAKSPNKRAVPSPPSRLRREILGIFLITLAVLVFLSLWSFSILDGGWFLPGDGATPHDGTSTDNWVGMVGALIAAGLIGFLGTAALAIPFLILLQGIRVFQEERWSEKIRSLLGSGLLVLSASTLIRLNHPSSIHALSEGIMTDLYAGQVGTWIAEAVDPLFAQLGSTVVLTAILFISIRLVAPFSIVTAFGRIPRGVEKIVKLALSLKGIVSAVPRLAIGWLSWFRHNRKPRANKPVKINRTFNVQDGAFSWLRKGKSGKGKGEDVPSPSPQGRRERVNEPDPVDPDAPEPALNRDGETSPSPQRDVTRKVAAGYHLPDPQTLLDPPPASTTQQTDHVLESASKTLTNTLHNFGITGKITEVHPGPVISMYEFEPGPGIKVARIVSLAHELAMALKAGSVRIVAPLPGKSTVGIEVPNPVRETVALQEILTSDPYVRSQSRLTLALGKDIVGRPYVADLKKMPHLLVAGATGAGKSVGLNSMLLSLLFAAHPDEVKLMLIDPKVLELKLYDGIPHLLHPVLTDPKAAARGLTWVVQEMERRYHLLAEHGVRDIRDYNLKVGKKQAAGPGRTVPPLDREHDDEDTGDPEPLPYIVVVVDEFADLMMMSPKDVEEKIARLAQKARASGIHLILATQRPSVDVVTGLIKANFPARIAFQVSSKIDSRTILDANGAEALLGLGDMLYLAPGGRLIRLHGSYVSDDEVLRVVQHVKAEAGPDYCEETVLHESVNVEDEQERDEVYEQAREIVLSSGQASASLIQRRLRVGYPRAARMVERMEEEGLVSTPGRDGRREVLDRQMAIEGSPEPRREGVG